MGQESDWDGEVPLLELLVSKSLSIFSIIVGENSNGSPASYWHTKITEPPPYIHHGRSDVGHNAALQMYLRGSSNID